MDEAALRKRLKSAKLLIGNVEQTVAEFLKSGNHAPVGAVMIDVDYYSSTNACLKVLEGEANRETMLPRVHIYLDDIIGGAIEMYGPYNGMLKSIDEFNQRHEDRKIHINQNLRARPHIGFGHQIYFGHIFSHPEYETYIGGDDQLSMEDNLKLR